ncbi:hypothetical protein I8752_30795 [Nostocaceae cyanobacterium CENA369]|uniref:Uncharacterized protein n=1 Tax=Dendronalium phyllosphericum CENA369 TaxID=1725256 RepID=A0A8J7IH44_9NOST|nr:hypothetical protein [Dendronalium phyllosphericum]MBH8577280.1 hypothetical protein [Dendronalium phyllosphericum CENA369]
MSLHSTGSSEACYTGIVTTVGKKLITKFLNPVELHHPSKTACTLLSDYWLTIYWMRLIDFYVILENES